MHCARVAYALLLKSTVVTTYRTRLVLYSQKNAASFLLVLVYTYSEKSIKSSSTTETEVRTVPQVDDRQV